MESKLNIAKLSLIMELIKKISKLMTIAMSNTQKVVAGIGFAEDNLLIKKCNTKTICLEYASATKNFRLTHLNFVMDSTKHPKELKFQLSQLYFMQSIQHLP